MNATLQNDVNVDLSVDTDDHGDVFRVNVTVDKQTAERYDVAGETQDDGTVAPWNGSFATGWVPNGTEDVGTLERMLALYIELALQHGRALSEVFTTMSWVTGQNDFSMLFAEFDQGGNLLL